MNRKMITYSLGRALRIEGMLLFIPFLLSILYQDKGTLPFFITMVLCLAIGSLMAMKKPLKEDFHIKEGLILVAGCWALFSIFGALPFFISREIPNYVDALFETVSGFTTTGSTILTDIERLSKSLLFWRSFTHFIGGMGVLVFVVAVLPMDRNQGEGSSINILKAEVPGPEFGKLTSRLNVTARILYGIYIVMTAVLVAFLLAGGMSLFDAVTSAFSTAGTGGFSAHGESIKFFNSTYLEIVLIVGMLAFGVNFNLYYAILMGGWKNIWENDELKYYLGIFATATIFMAIKNMDLYTSFGESLKNAGFTASSIMTTTGFVTVDFQHWNAFSQGILVLLMFIGASAGSTGGGLKVYRIGVLFKTVFAEVKKVLNPNRVVNVQHDGHVLEKDKVRSICAYFVIYMFFFVLSFVLISLEGKDLVTSFTAVATTINNVGPGLSRVGPVENFFHFSIFSKIILTIDMLAGRLEILPILILFVPDVWKRR
ncbi:cation transport protein [Peptostreptococcaceae bacterium oral taxon 113 str. W5053]|nr:cation transport protein [Peptostreptococcaceae bacterium oral taxon 113 str. W5053]